MFTYKTEKLSEHITQITDPSGVYFFLVQGERQAALVDTGVGFAGLKETVEALTTLPVTVILTHGHGDHAGGVSPFERVCLHPADLPLLSEHGMEMRMGYAASCMPPGTELTKADFLPAPAPDRSYLPLEDGQVFDLGGISLEIIHVPGHTKGSCSVLFVEERSILFGDACNANTLLFGGTTVGEYRRSLQRLQTFRNRFDKVYYSHGPAPEGPERALEDNIELCGRILERTDDAVPCDFMGREALRAAAIGPHFDRLDGKYGNIVYTEDLRRKDYV